MNIYTAEEAGARMARRQMARRGPRRQYQAAGLAGCVEMRHRGEGARVGVYASEQAGFESDPETPWSTVCEDHGTFVTHPTLEEALTHAAHPREWCEDCRELRPRVI